MSPSILIIDDEIKMGKALRHVLLKEGYEVEAVADPQAGLALLEKQRFHLLLCDLKMPGLSGLDVLERSKRLQPDLNVIMMTAYASAETAVESMKKGAYDYLIKPFSTDELKILIKRCLKTQALQQENALLREQLQGQSRPTDLVARSKAMRSVLERSLKVAPSEATVLITGESGTGKELVARIIHEASSRKDRPMVTVNCGALPETLLESELFGHRKGAFTGAVESRPGLFEAAGNGTVFLDEIGEISAAMQVKLLRVLQSGEFQRVGDPSVLQADVRIVAATNRNLEEMVESGRFRSDLYYRLNVVPIHIPSLRTRREDIVPLIDHIVERRDDDRPHRFTPEAVARMERYDWPGNVRELENAIEHAIVLSEGPVLDAEALPAAVRGVELGAEGTPAFGPAENLSLDELEKRAIQAAMEKHGQNITRAAKDLGVTRRTLGYRLHKHGLHRKDRNEDIE